MAASGCRQKCSASLQAQKTRALDLAGSRPRDGDPPHPAALRSYTRTGAWRRSPQIRMLRRQRLRLFFRSRARHIRLLSARAARQFGFGVELGEDFTDGPQPGRAGIAHRQTCRGRKRSGRGTSGLGNAGDDRAHLVVVIEKDGLQTPLQMACDVHRRHNLR
jgi:hypothetical protein